MGGQGRRSAARRGSLMTAPWLSCRQPTSARTAARRSWSLRSGWTPRTSRSPRT